MTFHMIDPTPNEIQALMGTSDMAGEYLESIGKTDLAALSYEEWMTLIEVIVTAYTDKLRVLDRAAGYASPTNPDIPF